MSLDRLEQSTLLRLARLGPKDLVRLLKDAFQSEHLAHELGAKIGEKSDGNPFFVFEIIRGLKEGQFLAQGPDGSWHTTRIIRDIQFVLPVIVCRRFGKGITPQKKPVVSDRLCRVLAVGIRHHSVEKPF